ncbi:hypothetical protein FOPE_08799 [Fonsecaea pedrosoi]|nr:hypothetical protein FOPE_08799 [Fonsecaea pedrosoi]
MTEEFGRKIDRESVEALFDKNFDVTDEPLPSGETCIPATSQDPRHGYVSGHMIPSGIYSEIVRNHAWGSASLANYVRRRWGLELDEEVIEAAHDYWVAEQEIRVLNNSQQSNQPAGESRSSVATTVHAGSPTFQGKAEHDVSVKCFSWSNVMDYLFTDLSKVDVYPEGPSEPVRFRPRLQIMRRFMHFRLLDQEARPLIRRYSFEDFTYREFLDPFPQVYPLAKLIGAFYQEMHISGCVTSRNALWDFPEQDSVPGWCFVLNHMRLSRGAPEALTTLADEFFAAAFHELLLSKCATVVKVLDRRRPRLLASVQSFEDLENLFTEIRNERLANLPIRLEDFEWHSKRLRIYAPNDDGDFHPPTTRWTSDAHDILPHRFTPNDKYQQTLTKSKDLVYGLLDSADTDFTASRQFLEGHVVEMNVLIQEDSPEKADMQTILGRIRGLNSAQEGLEISAQWWAAVVTNLALAKLDQPRRSTLWLAMSSE